MTNANYRCFDCKLAYKKDEERWKSRRIASACDYTRKTPLISYNGEHCNKGNPSIHYYTCIGNFYFSYWSKLINFYPDYSEGKLPYSGGAFEMPAKFVDVMDLVHNLLEEDKRIKEKNGAK